MKLAERQAESVLKKHAQDLDWITQKIRAQGLSAYEPALVALIKPAIAIRTQRAASDSHLVGASRIGGDPDLPADVEWPEGGEGMLFVAQLRLEELGPMDIQGLLPRAGILSFFLDRYVDVIRVFHFADMQSLARRKGEQDAFVCCDVELVPTLHLPPPSSHFIGFEAPAARPGCEVRMESVIALPQGAFEKYWDQVYLPFMERAEGRRLAGQNAVHQVLGYAHGLDDTGAQAADEELLLAIDSDDNAEMEWGDCQRPAIFIKREDLLARRFDRLRATT